MTHNAVVDLLDDSSQSSVEHERKVECKVEGTIITPQNRPQRKVTKKAATTIGKRALQPIEETKVDVTQLTVIPDNIQTTAKKRTTKFKDPPASQLRIDSYFKSCSKSYKIETPSVKEEKLFLTVPGSKITKTSQKVGRARNKKIKGRKRLFIEGDDSSSTTVSTPSGFSDMMSNSKKTDPKRSTTAIGTSKRIDTKRSTTTNVSSKKRNTSKTADTSKRTGIKRSTSLNATCSSTKPTKRNAKPYSYEELIDLCSDDDLTASFVTKKAFMASSERNKSADKEMFADTCEMPHLGSDYIKNDMPFAAMVSIPLEEICDKNTTMNLKEDVVHHRASYSSSCLTNNTLLQTKINTPHSNYTDYNLELKTEENVILLNKDQTSSKSLVEISIVASEQMKVKQEPEELFASTSLSNQTKEINNNLKLTNKKACSNTIITDGKNDLQMCTDRNLDITTGGNIIVNKEQTSSKSLVEISIVASDRVKVKQEPEELVASTCLPIQTKEINNLKLTNKKACSNTIITDEKNDLQISHNETPSTSKTKRVRKFRVCPPYKKVAGTTFAVDAFQYGQISGITHYFLTHFHADHYQGLTRKFEMPLYLSPITANLVRALISVENKYINEIELNKPVMINDVEVTAIDANHCPGAVMFIFKLSTGRCILHTGDFRASPDMESEPIFWNNDIDTIYLDTTYIAHKHNFASQYESIDRAKRIIREFHEKRPTTRVLYVCGSYVIGKERFWTNVAQEFNLKVWTEKNRLKALQSMDLDEVRDLLSDDPHKAEMHVISIAKVSYQSLVDYFRPFKQQYDAMLAFRPSGWEKNSKPQLRGEINIVGIEYSEHSSHAELERFVTYLKPREVISTVPVRQGNPCITPKIPEKWYKYDNLKKRQRNFQPSITSFLKMRPRQLVQNAATKRTTNCLTPTKSPDYMPNEISQLSVRAMATCIEVQRDNKYQATSQKVPAVLTLFPESEALDDWML
ncbi:DNA cross-link repair 1A protein [Bactrocera dorsalis]|uniref:DNA cross-link repair 1A protein n=1 Tax=Bactrocera dorsalis TaxID=27457 RepID=A0A6I9VDD9_BACDO|nr:DNA cross-link repair 1A protein [Bactrocera dorsalis]